MKKESRKIKIEDYNIYTYRRIRRAIGYLGISLPIFLVILSFVTFFQTKIQPSISHYYYTNLRDIFIGTLSAVGVFLIRYKGCGNISFWKNDNLLTNIAGIMALGVGFIPINPDNAAQKIDTLVPYSERWLGWLHYGFATILFLILALLAINVFTIGKENQNKKSKNVLNENNIYRFCGYSILFFIIMIPISDVFKLFSYSTLVFETLSLFAFGIVWLVKGRALGDRGLIGQKIYHENNPIGTEKVVGE